MATSEKEEKLRDARDMKKIIKYQQKHFANVLTHFDEQIAFIDEQIVEHDLEIAVLQEKKAAVARHFLEAPEQLIALAQELRVAEVKEHDLKTNGESRTRKLLGSKLASKDYARS